MTWVNKNATIMLKHMTISKQLAIYLLLGLLALDSACRSPLAEVKTAAPLALELKVTVEDHSRNLKRLRSMLPQESNSPAARAEALEAHRTWLETRFLAAAKERGLAVNQGAPLRLELALTSLGEVRAKYIVYGIASGVAWGVGTGLVAHDPRLALGLGLYELVEETAFWIAGSAVFGAYSAPAVVEATVFDGTNRQAVWKASYYILNGRMRLKSLPAEQRLDRATQLHATLAVFLDKLFKDLEALPGFPRSIGSSRALTRSSPSAVVAPATP